ncbi:hypothetical protein SSS_08051 [Sarcoptes scabiei]|nr:hypothetical protein SSS_08051 [Sarcoptes scabiei]UXI14916.1 serine/threonine-protein kinase [Sarcoptes scabiei]
MAMITIERIVSAKRSNQKNISENNNENNSNDQPTNPDVTKSSEIYIAVRGADIIFPHNECHRYSKIAHASISELLQKHLEAILQLLRPQDCMKMAVRLESQISLTRSRYLLVVSNETEQCCLLGIDYESEATIGLVLSIWNDMQIMLDGDGGFRITSGNRHHIFKPVSVQAMWSIFQALHLATKKSVKNNYYEGGGSHRWVIYYKNNIKSNSRCLQEWHTIVSDQSDTNYNNIFEFSRSEDKKKFKEVITSKLKDVMISVDLEQVTSKDIRNKLESYFKQDLSEYKSFIDKEMIKIMGQLEEPSKILDYLYLGSEWNASNFEELKGKGVQKILNVTSEIDNYFPGYFDYYNIRVEDDEATNMLRHLNDTYYYIRKAKDEGVKVLVHCKKGISRSASVVVAYIMKEKSYDLNKALHFVRNQRSSIRPNPAFLEQLEIYQGMLHANNNKKTMLKSNSDSELQTNIGKNECKKKFFKFKIHRKNDKDNSNRSHRRSSWSFEDNFVHHQENQDNCGRGIYCEMTDKNIGDYASTIKPSVKEKIEGFENKQPTTTRSRRNLIFSKKNVARNGLVSNLACQFEPKESAIIDISNFENHHKLFKPPIHPSSLSKDQLNSILQGRSSLPRSNLIKYSLKDEYSNKILKRTLSYDNLIDLSQCKYLQTNDNSSKKCKQSFPRYPSSYRNLYQNTASNCKNELSRACSLPNIDTECKSLAKLYKNSIKSTTEKKSTNHFKSSPLDLQFIGYQNLMNDNESDGFVKRRTEELEILSQSMNYISTSMPSTPNMITDPTIGRKSINEDNLIKLSNSFNCPRSYSKNQLPTSIFLKKPSMKIDQNVKINNIIKLKKTYGKSHPLDKLNHASVS